MTADVISPADAAMITGFTVDPAVLRARSADLVAIADAVRQLEPVVTRAIGDVLVSAMCGLTTAARAARALLHAGTNPVGLGFALRGGAADSGVADFGVADVVDGIGTALHRRGLAEELAADAATLRISAVTYERPELATSAALDRLLTLVADGEQLAAARSLDDVALGDIAPVLPELVALHALRDENPLNDAVGWEVVHGEQPSVDPVTGLPLGWLSAVVDPGPGHAAPAPTNPAGAQAQLGGPAGVDALLGNISELDSDGRMVIHGVRGTDGIERFVVQLPGMHRGDPLTTTPQDLAGAIRNAALPDSAYTGAVREAMTQAGVPHGAEVLLVGHSAGGLVAANLAADPAFNGGTYAVTDVLAVGSPVDHKAVPPVTTMITVTHDRDLVAALDGRGPGAPEHPVAGREEIRLTSDLSDFPASHDLDTYRRLLAAPQPGGSSLLAGLDAQLGSYTAGTVVDVRTFRLRDHAPLVGA